MLVNANTSVGYLPIVEGVGRRLRAPLSAAPDGYAAASSLRRAEVTGSWQARRSRDQPHRRAPTARRSQAWSWPMACTRSCDELNALPKRRELLRALVPPLHSSYARRWSWLADVRSFFDRRAAALDHPTVPLQLAANRVDDVVLGQHLEHPNTPDQGTACSFLFLRFRPSALRFSMSNRSAISTLM